MKLTTSLITIITKNQKLNRATNIHVYIMG